MFYFFTRIIYIPMAVKSDSNYTIIVYYCNTVVIVFNSTVYYRLPSFTVVLESLTKTFSKIILGYFGTQIGVLVFDKLGICGSVKLMLIIDL